MQVCLLRRRTQRAGIQGFCNLMLNGVVVRFLGYCRRMGENCLSHSDRTELVEKRGGGTCWVSKARRCKFSICWVLSVWSSWITILRERRWRIVKSILYRAAKIHLYPLI